MITEFVHEKILYFGFSLFATVVCWVGAIATEDPHLSHLYATGAVAILTSSACTLSFREAKATIQAVIGRNIFCLIGGAGGTRFVIYKFDWQFVFDDLGLLIALSSLCTIATYFVGYAFLKLLNRRSGTLAETLWKSKLPSTDKDE